MQHYDGNTGYYNRILAIPILIVSAFLGLLYVILLPFVGFIMLCVIIVQTLYHKVSRREASNLAVKDNNVNFFVNSELGMVSQDGGLPIEDKGRDSSKENNENDNSK